MQSVRLPTTIPNILTSLRILLIPVMVVVAYLPIDSRYLMAAAVFTVASITDWLDGYLARRWGETTPFGAFLDPVADIRRAPAPDAALDTQALQGEIFTAYEVMTEGWAWGQLEADGYVGYMPSSALWENITQPTHRICARSPFSLLFILSRHRIRCVGWPKN